jgi:DNA-binding Lrp family transcriptional regulator
VIAPLDATDLEILVALQADASLSNKELAGRIGLAASSCLERVRRLRRTGVLRGLRAQVDPAALGIGMQALVFVRLARHARRHVQGFRRHALGLPETLALYHVAGHHDFLVHVGVRDADHLRDLALDAFTTRREVARMETHLIFEHVSKPVPALRGEGGDASLRPAGGPRRRAETSRKVRRPGPGTRGSASN